MDDVRELREEIIGKCTDISVRFFAEFNALPDEIKERVAKEIIRYNFQSEPEIAVRFETPSLLALRSRETDQNLSAISDPLRSFALAKLVDRLSGWTFSIIRYGRLCQIRTGTYNHDLLSGRLDALLKAEEDPETFTFEIFELFDRWLSIFQKLMREQLRQYVVNYRQYRAQSGSA